MLRQILLFTAVFAFATASAQCSTEIDMDIIRKIESNGDPMAYNPVGGGSYGLYQIHPSCLQAYNKAHHSTISVDSLYQGKINRRIARWYLYSEIPRLLRHYNLEVNNRNKIICYNAGIRYLVRNQKLPAITEDYLKKYSKLCVEKAN